MTKEGIQHTKARLGASGKKKWNSKVQHGKFIRSKDRKLTSEEGTILWKLTGDLKVDTSSEIVASKVPQTQQMQAMSTV